MIRHTVSFTFKPTLSAEAMAAFFAAAKELANINGVENFECLKQVSTKNGFTHSLSMQFAHQEDYQQYNTHPVHTAFVQQYWLANVESFLEADFEPLEL
jgi:hypothetical protein